MKNNYSIRERINIGKEIFERLLESNYNDEEFDIIASKYNITNEYAHDLLRSYKKRVVDPKPSSSQLELFNTLLDGVKIANEKEKVIIGKELFDRLIETNYDSEVVYKEIENKYKYSRSSIIKYLREYRLRTVEPKPSKEDLETFDMLRKESTRIPFEKRILIAKDYLQTLLDSKCNANAAVIVAEKYGVATSTVRKFFEEYKERTTEPMPSKEQIALLNEYMDVKNNNSENIQYKIGKEVFERRIATKYDKSVVPDIAKKYNLTEKYVGVLASAYVNRTEEPKPNSKDLEKYYRYQKLSIISFDICEKLLNASDDILKKMLIKHRYNYLIERIRLFKELKPENIEDISKLDIISDKLKVMNDKLMTKRAEESKEKIKKTYLKKYAELYQTTARCMEEYINSNEYYPNYIFNSNGITNDSLNSTIKLLLHSNTPENKKLVEDFKNTLSLREEAFILKSHEVVELINNCDANIMDFYRMTHTSIRRFKTFMRIACIHRKLSGSDEQKINNFFDRYIIGSVTIPTFEKACEINYEYNGEVLTPEYIKEICIELANEEIPICRNTIIYTFEQKIKNKVNKK